MERKILKTAVLLLMFFSISMHAQFGLDAEAIKAQAREKKIEKSPARDEIKRVEAALDDLSNRLSWSISSLEGGDTTGFFKLGDEIVELEGLLPVIREKDPKWAAKNDYAPELSKYHAKWQKQFDDYKAEKAKESCDNWLRSKSEIARWKFFTDSDFHYLGHQYSGIPGVCVYEKFQEMMDKLDYSGTKEKFPQIIKEYPEFATGKSYKELKDFYDVEFPEFINGIMLEFLGTIQEECQEQFKSKPAECYDWLQDGINYCADVLTIFPGNSAYMNKKAEFQKLKDQFDKYLEENVYTSAFHKAHVGQTLFSNKPIIFGQEKEEDFKTTFKAGESIYAVTYWMSKRQVEFRFSLWIDGDVKYSDRFYASNPDNDIKTATCYTFAIFPDPAKTKEEHTMVDLQSMKIMGNVISAMEANSFGDKKMRISFYKKDTAFIIDYTEGFTNLLAEYEKLRKQRIAAVRLPKAVSSNSEIVEQWKKAVVLPGETIVAVRVLSQGWQYEKNSYGVILSRYAGVYGVVKNKDGVCTLLKGTVTQEKGDGGYTAPYIQLESTFQNADGNMYDTEWDGTDRVNGEDGFECDCSAVVR